MPQTRKIQAEAEISTDKFNAAIEAANKKWAELVDKLRASHKTYAEVEKDIERVAGQLKVWSTATKAADKVSADIINTQRQQLAGLRALRDEYGQAAQAQSEAERQLDAELQRTWNTTQRQIAEEAKLARQRQAESAKAARLQAKEEDDLRKAQEKQADSTAKLLKQSFLWAVGSASLYYAYRRLKNAVRDTFNELYGETEAYKELKAAADQARYTMLAGIISYKDFANAAGQAADALRSLTGWFSEWKANVAASRGIILSFAPELADSFLMLIPPIRDGIAIAGEFVRAYASLTGQTEILDRWEAARAQRLNEISEDTARAASATKDYSSEIQSLIRKLRDYNAAASEQVAATNNIISQFNAAAMDIRDEYISNVAEIEADLAKQIQKINAKALEQREKALASYYKNIEKAQRAAQKQEANNAAQHALEMEYAQRRYNLTLLQNERLYLYNRGQLVAEGDVLAIDDLDARYELEKQAQKENFDLQMQQAEAMYRLQARIQREAMRDSIAELQLGLREQLAEIEANRRDQVTEAQQTAAEKQAEAEKAATEALAKEQLAMQEQLAEQEKAHDERLADLAEYLAEFGQKLGFSYADTLSLAQNYFGVDGDFDTLFKNEWERQASYTEIFTAAIQRMVANSVAQLNVLGTKIRSIAAAGGGSGGFSGNVRTNPTGSRPYAYAYGGEFVTSTPTPIMVGERGPERVVVQPLSPIGVGGNVSMSWKGGPIPINATGSMSGADMGGVGESIAQNLVVEMNNAIRRYPGRRSH